MYINNRSSLLMSYKQIVQKGVHFVLLLCALILHFDRLCPNVARFSCNPLDFLQQGARGQRARVATALPTLTAPHRTHRFDRLL